MYTVNGPFWGMHLFWWSFWIIMMISVFGFNVPELARINSVDPHLILRRRLAKGEITEDDYKKITGQLRFDEESVRQDLTIQNQQPALVGHPITDGLSFSATWAILYSLCAIFFAIAPEAMTAAMGKLFHGLSFTAMAQTGTAFSFGDFLSVITIGAVYTFIAGVIWSLIHSYFLRQKTMGKLKKIEGQTGQKVQLIATKKAI